MAGIVAIVYDDPYKAHEARAALLRLAGEGRIRLDETAVAIKGADGKVGVYQDVDVVSKSTDAGHWLGIAAAWLTGTVPWIMAGTAAGAVLGRLSDHSITNRLIKEVDEALVPGTSALFVQGERSGDPSVVDPAFVELHRRFGGTLVRATLPPEAERALREAIETADAAR
jgi:uncharacterized membrane protein